MSIDNKQQGGGSTPLSKSEQDLADLQDELADRETGRPKRFRLDAARDDANAKARRSRDSAYRTALDLLRQDAEYAALYDEVTSTLGKVQGLAGQALADVNTRIDKAAAKLEEMEEHASMLPDGTRVFRDADGRVFTADGRELTADELADVDWNDAAPSWEEYRRQRETLQKAAADRDAILDYQHQVLDPARERLNDADNPPSKEELKQIEEVIADRMPPSVKEILPSTPEGQDHSLAKSHHEISSIPTL